MKEIQLTQGKVAIVDDQDYDYLNQFKWHVVNDKRTSYAQRWVRGENKYSMMHREILNCPSCLEIDHKNHDGLDNRRSNIRICFRNQNNTNSRRFMVKSSKYRGVTFSSNKWLAKIKYLGQTINLGRFDKEELAALAYDVAALKLWGEFATINIIDQYRHFMRKKDRKML